MSNLSEMVKSNKEEIKKMEGNNSITEKVNGNSEGMEFMVTEGKDLQENPTPDSQENPTPDSQENPTPDSQENPTPDSQENPTPDSQENPTPDSQENPTPDSQEEVVEEVKPSEPTKDTYKGSVLETLLARRGKKSTSLREEILRRSGKEVRHISIAEQLKIRKSK